MGSMIQLSVGNLDIDWGKNAGFTNHSPLYQETDVQNIPYWYVKDHDNTETWELFAEYREGTAAPLAKIVERLQLLGFTYEFCKNQFEYFQREYYFPDLYEKDEIPITFSDLEIVFKKIDTTILTKENYAVEHNIEEKFNLEIHEKLKTVLPGKHHRLIEFVSGSTSADTLHPYTLLHLLSLNPLNASLPVRWGFNDVVTGGWVDRSTVVKPLDKADKFLIVTEGSSDSSIIKHALKILKPNISDFFDFVDMNEGYPFSGTGNLVNFTKGLISIGIQNNVIVIFDNDTQGIVSFNNCQRFNTPSNMRIIKLPDLSEFEIFNCIGPNGEHRANINGTAAAIECYLDTGPIPIVRWNNFEPILQTYQGELMMKDNFKREFLSQRTKDTSYDYTKIGAVLNTIITHAINIKESFLLGSLERSDNVPDF